MIPRLVTLFVALVVPLTARDAEVRPGATRSGVESTDSRGLRPAPRPAIADTILRPDLTLPGGAVRAGLTASADEPHVTLGMRRIRVGPEGLGQPRTVPFGTASMIGPPPRITVEPIDQIVLRGNVRSLGLSGADLFLPPAPRARVLQAPDDTDGRFVTDYADLALNVRSRMELGGAWSRFEPCDATFGAGCNPSLIPQLSPDVQFGVQVNGSILDRVFVDVDFDQAREFDAANRINFFYQGGEDDVLRRLEVGDVTFRLPQSRFLTEGIPAGNFGFQAEGQVGAVDF